jgi:hypothetical protein
MFQSQDQLTDIKFYFIFSKLYLLDKKGSQIPSIHEIWNNNKAILSHSGL